MDTNETAAVQGLNAAQLHAWLRFVAVVELVPGLLDSQLQRDSALSHFEYYVLAMLSEAPNKTLRMTGLSSMTNSSLPRLSHVEAAGPADLASLTALALGEGPPTKIVSCGDIPWSWLGLSMAGWNALISAGLAIFSLMAAKRPKDARAPRS